MPVGSSPAAEIGTERLAVLDGLRGIAAICVVFLHRESIAGSPGLFFRSYLAVDFFFMLSGFVMVSYIERDRSPVAIMFARLKRLWPLMGFGTMLGLLAHLALADPVTAWAALLPSLLFIPPAFLSLGFPLNGPQWSLLIELIANLAHAVWLRHCKTSVLIAISAMSWCALTVSANLDSGLNITGENAWSNALLRGGFAYPLGCALARLRTPRCARPARSWWLALVLLPAVLLGPALLEIPVELADPVVLLCCAPILLLAAQSLPPVDARQRLHGLGALSFPLYAVHFPLLEIGRWFALRAPPGWHALPQLAALAAVFIVARTLAISPINAVRAQAARAPSCPH